MLQPMIAPVAALEAPATPETEPSATDLGRQCLEIVRQALQIGIRREELCHMQGVSVANEQLGLEPALSIHLARLVAQYDTLIESGYTEPHAIATLADTRILQHLATAATPQGDRP